MTNKRIDEKPALVEQTEEQCEMECLNDENISIEMLDERVEFALLIPLGSCTAHSCNVFHFSRVSSF